FGFERAHLEKEAIAPVVERVEEHREVFVLEDDVAVAPELGDDVALRMAVPAACGHVHVLVVEEHPDVGLLGRGLALPWQYLDEIADRLDRRVKFLVHAAVKLERLRQASRPDRGVALLVTVHYQWRKRRRGPIDRWIADGRGVRRGRPPLLRFSERC